MTLHDVLTNLQETTIHCLDKGHVRIVDVMPRLVPEETKTADYAVVQAARVSYGQGTKTVNEDDGLIRYLMRHTHSTPNEMVEFKFHCKMPIFVARQWIRHRTANVNEISGRYSVLNDEFYIPDADDVRQQSKMNKQGGEELITKEDALIFQRDLETLSSQAYDLYKSYLDQGVSREQARMILPVNLYTEWYWKCDLHNILHFLALRCDKHAQKEIRVFGEAMLSLIEPIVPFVIRAWNDYNHYRGGMKLSRLEIEAIRNLLEEVVDYFPSGRIPAPKIVTENKREQAEWIEKAARFGFSIA